MYWPISAYCRYIVVNVGQQEIVMGLPTCPNWQHGQKNKILIFFFPKLGDKS